jgi:decaprenyl-phosphate phosphoribosyltransferase
MMKKYFNLIRAEQWIKNTFMILPFFFAGKLFETKEYLPLVAGMICFSLVASIVYIINDYIDIEDDKCHPEKCHRPLASGAVTHLQAFVVALCFFFVAFPVAFQLNVYFFYLLLCYFIMNLLYTFKLKHIPIIDIFIIALGFIFRIEAGGIIANIALSKWLVIITFLLALFLALAKRRDDVLIYNANGKKMRKSIQGYNLDFINSSMMAMTAVIIVSYIMYTTSDEIEIRMDSKNVYLTTFFVILGLFRYLQLSFVELKSGSPTKTLLKDRFIQITILAWIGSFYLILYKLVA